MKNITLTIDGRQVTGPEGSTILEIAKSNGIDVPTLCHDQKLEPFGSCFFVLLKLKVQDDLCLPVPPKQLKAWL